MDIKLEHSGEIYKLNSIAKQSDSAILYKKGKLVLLVSVAVDINEVLSADFLPLTVQYIEKSYANGKIPGGYVKREGKPSDFESLTSRLIDRSIRPLFPKDFKYCTQIIVMVLSADDEVDIHVSALNAVSVALHLSSIPFKGIINAVRVASIDGEFVINPNMNLLDKSTINLFMAGDGKNITMIEFKSIENEFSEDLLLRSIDNANSYISNSIVKYQDVFKPYIKDKITLTPVLIPDIQKDITSKYLFRIYDCFKNTLESPNSYRVLAKDISYELGVDEEQVIPIINKLRRQYIRDSILNDGLRLDGRGLKDIRNIDIETNILPSAHGSTLFTRGQTQVLSVCTIGSDNDMQSYDVLSSLKVLKEKFMLHYNFLPFCTGETYPLSSVSRRELGHGNLAKKALESSIAHETRAIRIVSEVLESNGSSSMASVCSGSLALYSAGITPSFLVAGIAMGLVKEDDKYKILSDITGIEDSEGDMDFKIAGNLYGITALQLDVKIYSFTIEILQDVLYQAKEARLLILNKMEKAKEHIVLGDNTPLYDSCKIPLNRISSIIGQAGKNIKYIIDRFNVNIDINKENGVVNISGKSLQNIKDAKEYILSCVYVCLDSFNVGDKFNGKVKRITDFGIFVELKDGIDGLLHNSKLDVNIINSIKEGEFISVSIIAINDNKIELCIS